MSAQGLELLRDYPGAGPYQCPAFGAALLPTPEDQGRAGQLAASANDAIILADFERAQAILAQAVQLDPSSPDLAYRHARVLEDLGEIETALPEFCRALDLDVESIGIFDVQDRIFDLYEVIRERVPDAARLAFIDGLAASDSLLLDTAVDDFTEAIRAAPEWGMPRYNRAVIYESVGLIQESLTDYRVYVELSPGEIDPIVAAVTERIGELEGAASVGTPSPSGALALGVVPGMAHYYTGRPLPGTATLVMAASAVVFGASYRNVTTLCVDVVPTGGSCPTGLIVDEITERPYLWYGVGIAAVVTVAAAVEAMIKAKRRRAAADAIGRAADDGLEIRPPSVSSNGTQLDLNLLRLRFR